MLYIEAPYTYHAHEPSLFLAGGITGCLDWQKEMVDALQDLPLVIFNPRRLHFTHSDDIEREQVIWEYTYLLKATALSFWFPEEALCPIALYELGAWCMTEKKIFLGIHPNYPRSKNIRLQTALARPDISIVQSLQELQKNIRLWSTAVRERG